MKTHGRSSTTATSFTACHTLTATMEAPGWPGRAAAPARAPNADCPGGLWAAVSFSADSKPAGARSPTLPGGLFSRAEAGYRKILKDSKIVADPRLNAILQRVGRRIAEASRQPGFEWEFNLREKEEPNAFCLPGGMAAHTGILPIAKNEAGLVPRTAHHKAPGGNLPQPVVFMVSREGLEPSTR